MTDIDKELYNIKNSFNTSKYKLNLRRNKSRSKYIKENKKKITKNCKNIQDKLNQIQSTNFPSFVKTQMTLNELLILIKKKNIKNVIDFIELFPPSGTRTAKNTQPHVFEALWKIIFLLKYDNYLNIGETREFYKTLEKEEIYSESVAQIFVKTKVNDGNSSGIVDIYFKNIKSSSVSTPVNVGWSCEGSKIPDENLNDQFLFSCKYYQKEKGASHYDIQDIFIEAVPKMSKFNILLLIKNKYELKKKMDATSKEIAKRFFDIKDVNDLDIYYKKLLYNLKEEGIDYVMGSTTKESTMPLNLRLHQEYFVKYTSDRIAAGDKQFIWGAVPRSGKSYMIAGLIARDKPDQVLIILGAKSETMDQFKKMFEDYDTEFGEYEKHYNVISGIDPAKKNIVIISQEKGWRATSTTQPKILDVKLRNILVKTNKLIFFDEIHKGASVGKSQEQLLKEYVYSPRHQGGAFIMVTATFAKPLIRYMSKSKGHTKLMQWGYDDIQIMKEISKEGIYERIIDDIKDTDDGIIKSRVFKKIIDTQLAQGITLDHIAAEYQKYPELQVICPTLESDIISGTDVHGNKFKYELNADLICNTLLKSSKNKLKSPPKVMEFLKYIKTEIYEKLLNQRFNYSVLDTIHSQIWFLPTPAGCPGRGKKTSVKKEKNKIEWTTRHLSKLMMSDTVFRERFCIIVVHGQLSEAPSKNIFPEYSAKAAADGGTVPKYDKYEVNTYMSSGPCVSTKCGNSSSVSDCIKKEEAAARKIGKSVIILTGMKLRLGISLPCVDIALHMDPISSVDTIYQSMFRVLTERKGKKKGFFIDLLHERFITFLYKYDDYTNPGKKNIDIQSKRRAIIDKMFSFNINGVNNLQKTDEKYNKLYSNILDKLQIDNIQNFSEKLFKDKKITLEKSLESEDIKDYAKDLYRELKNLDMLNSVASKKPIRLKLDGTRIGKTSSPGTTHSLSSSTGQKSSKKGDVKEEQMDLKKLVNYINDILGLYILFEDEIKWGPSKKKISADCSRHNLDELIIKMGYPIPPSKLSSICDNNKFIVDCYFSSLNSKAFPIETSDVTTQKDIIKRLERSRTMIINFLKSIKDKTLYQELSELYCFLRDKLYIVKEDMALKDSRLSPKCSVSSTKHGGSSSDKIKSTDIYMDDNILKIIRRYLVIKDKEKKLFGEVFTPVELICEMLDKLPKSVWTNPKLKWLDPANGIGNFPIVVYYKLMKGLEGIMPDSNKRSKHIIENMLYMVELNPVNCKLCKKIFKMINPTAKPRVIKADFLEWSKVQRTEFDIIIGNPPYQNINKKGDNHLYIDFTVCSLNILKKDGHLLFITPKLILDNLLRCEINRKRIDKVYNIKYIAIDTPKRYFKGIGTNFIYFLLQKNQSSNISRIEYLFKKKKKIVDIEINEGMYIPNIISEPIFDIINKTTNKIKLQGKILFQTIVRRPMYEFTINSKKTGKSVKKRVQRIREKQFIDGIVKKKSDSIFKYKMSNGFSVKKYPYPGELCYFNHKMIDYGISKIVINNIGFVINYDDDGTLNLSDSLNYILGNNTDLKKKKKLISSKLMKFLLYCYKNNTQHDTYKIINKNLYNIPLDECSSDKKIFTHYNITQKEIKLIEEVLSPSKASAKAVTTKDSDPVSPKHKSPVNEVIHTTPHGTEIKGVLAQSRAAQRSYTKHKSPVKVPIASPKKSCGHYNMRECKKKGCVYSRKSKPKPCTEVVKQKTPTKRKIKIKKTTLKTTSVKRTIKRKKKGGKPQTKHGGSSYSDIYNPLTNKRVRLKSSSGIATLKRYIGMN